jgi:hypothetical protein
LPGTGLVFFIGSPKTNPAVARVLADNPFPSLSDQGIVLRRVKSQGREGLVVGGGAPRATLRAVYHLVETWGVHYLVDRDVLPAKALPLQLPLSDTVLEPTFKVRAHPTIQDLVASGEAWGMADFRPLIDQLAKMKFTRMNVYTFGWQPYLHWEYKGIARRTAALWYGYHYPITPHTIGRELFGDVAEFWNPDLPLTSVEALKADSTIPRRVALRQCKYLNNVIEQDHRTVKKRVWLAKGYGSFQSAWRTLQGIETVNMIRKGRVSWLAKGDAVGQAHFIGELFGLSA